MVEESKQSIVDGSAPLLTVPTDIVDPMTVASSSPLPLTDATADLKVTPPTPIAPVATLPAEPSAIVLPNSPGSRAPAKKRRSGIDGLDLNDDGVYAMQFGDTKLRPIRVKKSTLAAAAAAAAANGTAATPSEERKDETSKAPSRDRKKARKEAASDSTPLDDASASPPVAAGGNSTSKKSSTKKGAAASAASKKRPSSKKSAATAPPHSASPAHDAAESAASAAAAASSSDADAIVPASQVDAEKKRPARVRDHRKASSAIPRDAESKNLYAQRYRLLQERNSFIQHRRQTFYMPQIVDRYPTPRFPYLDQRNLALWQPDAESRRAVERVLTETKKQLQEQMTQRVIQQEATRRDEAAAAAAAAVTSAEDAAHLTESDSDSESQKRRGSGSGRSRKKHPRPRAKKVMPITSAEEEETTPTVQPLGRQTQNSLADSLALETALKLSSADAPPESADDKSSTSPTASAPSSSPSATATGLLGGLPAPSFTRSTPLLRVGNFILYDNPDLTEWEAARIIAVNKSRTRMQIEAVVDQDSDSTGSRRTPRPDEPDVGIVESPSPSPSPQPPRWVDLDTAHFFEYIDVVWAKVKGFDWWPAELCEEVEAGSICPAAKGHVHVAFCEDTRTIQQVGANAILPYFDYRDANATSAKRKKKGFEESFHASEEVWRTHMWQAVLEESERREREAEFLHRLLRDTPTFYLGKRVAVFWPLDEAWYAGVIKQYNLHTKKHCILYDDDAVEWIDVQKEKIVLATFALSVNNDAELPNNPAHIKSIYKTYQHQQYELRDRRQESDLASTDVTIIGRDFLPDYVPRIVEQVDSKDVAGDPRDAKLVAHSKQQNKRTNADAPTETPALPAPAPALDLSTLNCWECGLDLERWNGPGLLSSKYGGSSNPNKKEEPAVEVISCGRCTKVVHSFCLQLMLKRKNQTEHAMPTAGDGDAAAGHDGDAAHTGTDVAEVEASEKVLPPHLSCTIANPRCPDCLRCEHCFLISNKSGSVEDLVTCDICQMRVHLQCIDPAFDPEKHARPTDGWVCTMCVQCRCCSATHSLGGESQLPPLPPPPGEKVDHEHSNDASASAVSHAAAAALPAIAEAQAAPDADPTAAQTMDVDSTATPAVVDGNLTASSTAPTAADDPDHPTFPAASLTLPGSAPVDAATASGHSKRKKTKKRGWSSRPPPPPSRPSASQTSAISAAARAKLPFSQRFVSKWVDTDEESADEFEVDEFGESHLIVKERPPRPTTSSLVPFTGSGPDESFWSWTNSFTVCQPCGYRLQKRKYCPICVVIYDLNTPEAMVQCDSCERWVHIACDPNAQANQAKLTKDNTTYSCLECLRRERSDELMTILDELIANDTRKSFLNPVSEAIAPSYFATIKTPMEFSTIDRKLMELQYQGIDQFKYDLNLIWRNAKDYNPPHTAIHKSAVRLQNRSTELFKQLAAKHTKGGLFDQTIGRIEDEEEERKKAEAEREMREAENRRKRLLKRQSEAQHPRPSRLEYYSCYLSFDDVKLCEVDTCLLCGSIGDHADFIFCIDCGECAHSWCYASALQADVAPHGVEANIDQALFASTQTLQPQQLANFRCPNCQTCSECATQEKKVRVKEGPANERMLDSFVTCTHCNSIAHVSCVPYLHGKAPRAGDPYKCPQCVSCRCCQSRTAGRHSTDSWSPDFSLCHPCYKLYLAGSVCPVCDVVYKPRDESTPMMCCDRCACWIHMQCDGLTLPQYIALTQDASKKYYCPTCRTGHTTASLNDDAEKDAAKRLMSDKKRVERNKLSTHVAFCREELPAIHTPEELVHSATNIIERIRAHQRRMNAMKRHQATVLINQAIMAEREQHRSIAPIEPPSDLAIYERQSNRTFQLIQAIVMAQDDPATNTPLTYDVSTIPSPAHAFIKQDVEMKDAALVTNDVKAESVTVKVEPTETLDNPAGGIATIDTVDVKMEPMEEGHAAPSADVPPLDGAIEMDTSNGAQGAALTALLSSSTTTTAAPPSVAASVASPALSGRAVHPTLQMTPDQAMSYLLTESAHAARKDDDRICAFCRKRGDQESAHGEGRLLPSLCVVARWVHVQCALWTDRVSTNVKGQMNVLSQINKVDDALCTVCGLPGASLRCKRGHHACGKYHFACARARHCLFTVEKEFHCELHSSGKRAQDRQARLERIERRMIIQNAAWNKRGLFAMRAREVEREVASRQSSSGSSESGEVVLSREVITAHESMLSEYYSDYEDSNDGLWKRRKLTFASKAALREEAEATHRARGLARNEDDDNETARPILSLAEREALLRQRHARVNEVEAVDATHDSDEERGVKEEEDTNGAAAGGQMDVDDEDKASSVDVKTRKRSRNDRRTRRDTKKDVPPPRNKELERLLATLPAVYPTTTEVFLRIGALSVTDLGEIVPESPFFHDAEYVYPLGYRATRLYWSYMRPGQRTAYVCEILGYTVVDPTLPVDQLRAASSDMLATAAGCPTPERLAPIFRITVSDDPTPPILARSAPIAWSMLMKHFPAFERRNAPRPRMRTGDTFSWSLGGSAFFGISVKQVMAEMEVMPRVESCTRYRFKQLQRMVDIQKAQQEAKEAKEEQEALKAAMAAASQPARAEGEVTEEKAVLALVPSATAVTNQPVAAAHASSSAELHPSGCARTHGYDPRTKVKAPRSGPGPAPKAMHADNASSAAFSAITVVAEDPSAARRRKAMLQAADRRPQKELPLSHQYRIMKASAPRARVAHSIIHEWGLFANQDLEEGAMVIEYLGELIRPRIADLREKYYEDTGVDSCYMFRIDDDYIVDSTKRGNISRFINHSCDPNCKTNCIDSSGGKKIVVLANRPIAKDEEITYDYFFASENEKIRCNCGAINCSGRLN